MNLLALESGRPVWHQAIDLAEPPAIGDDAELMRRYREGDDAAFAILYHRHRGALYRYALRLATSLSQRISPRLTAHDARAGLHDGHARAVLLSLPAAPRSDSARALIDPQSPALVPVSLSVPSSPQPEIRREDHP